VKSIAVVGAGYVGLTTGICLAQLGHQVAFLEIDSTKIELLQRGVLPIFEPDLLEMYTQCTELGRITVTNDPATAIRDAKFIFLCVPTPQDEDGSADLGYIISAVHSIRELLPSNSFLVTKSTVPVGSSHFVNELVDRADITVLSSPEFLREGSAVRDFMCPDRIVVGTPTEAAADEYLLLFTGLPGKRVVTDRSSAELIKYVSNCLLATRLSLVNDVAAFCEEIGANMRDVTRGVGLDARIGDHFLDPGPGWGGSCLPKDLPALRVAAEKVGVVMPILTAAIDSNERAHKRVVDRIEKELGGNLVGRRIGLMGLAFKANTDDIRNSPAIEVAKRFISRGATVGAYDPVAVVPDELHIEVFPSASAAATDADAIVFLTEWDQFSDLEPNEILTAMIGNLVLDTRNIITQSDWRAAGANVLCLGQSNL
jgi:UDPglucose 6-dehydrogenase